MRLRNLPVCRFVRHCLKKTKNRIKYGKTQLYSTDDLFPFEYVYYTNLAPDLTLTARIIRNGEPYCMYYSPNTFNPLGNFEISEREKRTMLEDLKPGKKIDGLTFLHPDPKLNEKPTLLEDLINSIRELNSSS